MTGITHVTVQPPRGDTYRALACTPLPSEWKICYALKKSWEYLGMAFGKLLGWTTLILVRTISYVAMGVAYVLCTPFYVLQLIFSAIFTRRRLQNYQIGHESQNLTNEILNKNMQALSNRKKGVEKLTITHGGPEKAELDESLFKHLMIINPETILLNGCILNPELERKLTTVLDFNQVKMDNKGSYWVKQPRIEKETLSVTNEHELVEGLRKLAEKKVRIHELSIVSKNKEGPTWGVTLNDTQSDLLRSLKLRYLVLKGCWMETNKKFHDESFSVRQYSSKTLLEDLHDLETIARLRA